MPELSFDPETGFFNITMGQVVSSYLKKQKSETQSDIASTDGDESSLS